MLLQTARKVVIFIIGTTIVLIGVVMIIAPGPAFIVIPAGLAVLGTEFVWAKLLLKKVKATAKGAFEAMGVGGNPGDGKKEDAPSAEASDDSKENSRPQAL